MDPKVVTDRIIEVVKNFEQVTAAKVTPEAKFKEDLNLDSLDAVVSWYYFAFYIYIAYIYAYLFIYLGVYVIYIYVPY